jgi:hypothetical protein
MVVIMLHIAVDAALSLFRRRAGSDAIPKDVVDGAVLGLHFVLRRALH